MKKEVTKYYHVYVGNEAKAVLTTIQALCEDRLLSIDDECYDQSSLTLSIAPNKGTVRVKAGVGGTRHETTPLLGILKALRETNTPPKPKFIETYMTGEGWLSDEALVSKGGDYVDYYMFRVFKTGVQLVSMLPDKSIVGWIPRDEVEQFTKAFKQLDNR